jgi:PAS domain-containing protein
MDGDNFGDGRHQERRRHPPAGQSPTDILRQLPAVVVLQRMPVPVLAVGDDGTILFANAAFSQMLGHSAEAVLSLTLRRSSPASPPTPRPSCSSARTHTSLSRWCTATVPPCEPR